MNKIVIKYEVNFLFVFKLLITFLIQYKVIQMDLYYLLIRCNKKFHIGGVLPNEYYINIILKI